MLSYLSSSLLSFFFFSVLLLHSQFYFFQFIFIYSPFPSPTYYPPDLPPPPLYLIISFIIYNLFIVLLIFPFNHILPSLLFSIFILTFIPNSLSPCHSPFLFLLLYFTIVSHSFPIHSFCLSLSLYLSISFSLYLSVSLLVSLSLPLSLSHSFSLSLILSLSHSLFLSHSLSVSLSLSLSQLFTVLPIISQISFPSPYTLSSPRFFCSFAALGDQSPPHAYHPYG